jgi:diacylglycerol kinase (ATP)
MTSSSNPSPIMKRIRSFQYAFEGCWHVIRSQPNAWIHAGIMAIVIGMAYWLRLSTQDWAVLVLTFTVVWMAEFANTAVEAIVDLSSPEIHPLAKVAKDVTAGMVLVGAIGAVLVGLLILGPPLLAQIF